MNSIERELIFIHTVGFREWFHGEFQPGFWKKSSWNESGDYKEKVSARAENPSQAPVVQRVDNTIHCINHYPLDYLISFGSTYLLDSHLFSYSPLEQLGPETGLGFSE